MSELYSFRKVFDDPKTRQPFSVPYWKMVKTYCDHPREWLNKDKEIISEIVYSSGFIKCPRCKQVYHPV